MRDVFFHLSTMVLSFQHALVQRMLVFHGAQPKLMKMEITLKGNGDIVVQDAPNVQHKEEMYQMRDVFFHSSTMVLSFQNALEQRMLVFHGARPKLMKKEITLEGNGEIVVQDAPMGVQVDIGNVTTDNALKDAWLEISNVIAMIKVMRKRDVAIQRSVF